ncbi:MAG: glucosaminidase [Pelagibacteraceae bacterium]|nr:MAG: glucosaminidase [Pelagibacteraceae bacterium]RUA13817.1 MAG: glucosaminidase [Alphaproteobacteria bacterium]
MSKLIEKLFKSYRDQLLHLAKLYGIVEVKGYARSAKKLTTSQLELLLIKNRIKLPINRSSDKAIAKQELKENSITNIYLSICFVIFIGCLIVVRPYIKTVVNEVKFTYVAQEYKSSETTKIKKTEKNQKTEKIQEPELFASTPDNTISLNAETTLNLFEDLNYDLKAVRAGQKVKPIYLTKLPKDLKTLGDTKTKRELFIKIVLPLILHENEKIIDDRKRLFKILGKNFNSPGEKVWLNRRFKEYKIEDKDLAELKMRMDIIPVSIAVAQAANESGWGTSRFALEGNALFGQWTWSKKGISPKNKDPDQSHKILQFQILKASVRAYKNNLNTHNAYKEFREVRAKLRQSGTTITGLALIKYLKRYASIGEKYTEIIEGIMVQNSLTDFDKANLLPTKLKKGIAL